MNSHPSKDKLRLPHQSNPHIPTPSKKPSIKYVLIDTFLIHCLATCLNILLAFLRDKYIQEICWSSKPECSCGIGIAIYHLIFGVIIQCLCPLSVGVSIMFGFAPQLLRTTSGKMALFVPYFTSILLPYIFGFFYIKGSPRAISYIIHLNCALMYSLVYVRKAMGCKLGEYLRKTKFVFLFDLTTCLHYLIVSYVGPQVYWFLIDISQENSKNYFQLVFLTYTFISEALLSYIFTKIVKIMDITFLILIGKYYYILIYSMKIGNILYLDSRDWGFYLQMVSFLIFIFQHTTGISISSTIFVSLFRSKLKKNKNQKNKNSYGDYNNQVLRIWHRIFSKSKTKNSKIFSSASLATKRESIVKKVSIKFTKRENFNSGEISQRKAFAILFYQKLEFLLIYVPTLLYLWLHRSWKGPEPYYIFTVGCGFELTNIDFQTYSIVTLIGVDLIASVGFTLVIHYNNKFGELYQVEKLSRIPRILILMGYQMTFEYWVTHFSSYKLIRDQI